MKRSLPSLLFGSDEGLARQLEQAGLSKGGTAGFRQKQIRLAGTGSLAGAFLLWFGLPAVLPVTLGVLGFLGPRWELRRRIGERRRQIQLNLPYYLDLATLALEAGLDLIAALEEILRNDRPQPLHEEMEITLNSIRMGSTRSEAFARLSDRTGVHALSLLASSVAQSEELGTGLGGLFRLQSESLRRELYREAEEAAQRAPMKILVPLIGLIFPVVFLLLFAPLALRFFF